MLRRPGGGLRRRRAVRTVGPCSCTGRWESWAHVVGIRRISG